MRKLEIVLSEIETNLEHHDLIDPTISAVSIGWQLEHIMMVINSVVATIEKSNPEDYAFQFKPIRYYILFRKKIPRGRAKAPKVVQPVNDHTRSQETLRLQLEQTKASIQTLKNCQKGQFFAHPYFGNMKRNAAIRFLAIHSNHHLDIVKDIKTKKEM